MKTNENIVTIANGEAYGRIYTTTYVSDQPGGSVLLAIIMTEQVKRHERKDYDRATGCQIVVEPELLHTIPTYVFGVKRDACKTEQEVRIEELIKEVGARQLEGRGYRDKIHELETNFKKVSKERDTFREHHARASEAKEDARTELAAARAAIQRLEADLGKVRMHIGKKAFDEAVDNNTKKGT